MRRRQYAYVSALEEYSAQYTWAWKPGTYIIYVTFQVYTYATYFINSTSNVQIRYCTFAIIVHFGWLNANQQSSIIHERKMQSPCFMSSQSCRFWADYLWCLWGRLAQFIIIIMLVYWKSSIKQVVCFGAWDWHNSVFHAQGWKTPWSWSGQPASSAVEWSFGITIMYSML